MQIKPNQFKQSLAQGQVQIGLWSSLSNNYSAEIVAGSGYDWILLDMEHSPNDLKSVLSQLQAIAPYHAEPLVRLYKFDKDLVKLYLDMGVRGFVFANVESADTAREIVASTRYPAQGGFRGVAGQQRGNRWGRMQGYAQHAHEELCLMLQVESLPGVEHAREIASVEGVDGIFVGPNDLAACMGHMGHSNHPVVQKAIREVLDAIIACRKAPGILAVLEEDAKRYIEWGYTMVGIGSDQGLLIKASDSLVQRFREHLSTRG
ncbi:MAG: HpcH/HpaI aldolase/citrate lyase family protein [Alphaproteobacteria bacterium]|nr:HpcH/HpaI aldolase/citrate lyase family protein [Alphaproteobacteria bacterium]